MTPFSEYFNCINNYLCIELTPDFRKCTPAEFYVGNLQLMRGSSSVGPCKYAKMRKSRNPGNTAPRQGGGLLTQFCLFLNL